jgi:uncharacterized protein YdbL (DUF1318 family)
MKTLRLFFAIAFGCLFLTSCSIQAPEINVTGEKTALQNQVLGTFQQIEKDTWIIASSRAVGSGQATTLSGQKQKVLEAVENRKFNKDEIDELKRDKVVGEDNRGFLHIFETERYTEDANYKKLVDRLTEEENNDRKVVYERVLAVNPSVAEAGDKVNEIFAKLNYDNSKAGTLIQKADGTWHEKSK